MAARIGPDDVDFFASPRPELLHRITGLEPEPSGVHVSFEGYGFRSTQRLAVGDDGAVLVTAFWPAELKSQALYLYEAGRAGALIASARRRGWRVRASPHLAFFNSHRSQRLYLDPDVDAEEYARRWQEEDRPWIGRHPASHVADRIWHWLIDRGYAARADDRVLEQFLAILGRRRFADLRAGMRVRREWGAREIRGLGGERELAVAIRSDVDAILGAAGEPALPASR